MWSSLQDQRMAPAGPPSWMGSQIEEMRDASGLMYRRNRYYDPSTGRFTQEDPIGIAGGINLYGYAEGDPIRYRDPYGLEADTIEIDKLLRPAMDECAARSATCRQMVDSLATDGEWHRIKLGNPGDCQQFKIGCWKPEATPGHDRGSTIIIIPGEFGTVNWPIDPTDVVGHEIGHGVRCQQSEACAVALENVIRGQRGRPLRP